MNVIPVDNKWFEYITDENHAVEEVELYERKGQKYGYRIYKTPDPTREGHFDVPDEMEGYWKGELTWGDMCGEMDQKDLVRVERREEIVTVTEVYWDVV